MTGLRQAVILAGGRGTRLRALAATTTKLLLPIAGETSFLDTLIENILLHGITDIVLPAGHLGKAVEAPYTGVSMRRKEPRHPREPASRHGRRVAWRSRASRRRPPDDQW